MHFSCEVSMLCIEDMILLHNRRSKYALHRHQLGHLSHRSFFVFFFFFFSLANLSFNSFSCC
jgi:hypothetical protein